MTGPDKKEFDKNLHDLTGLNGFGQNENNLVKTELDWTRMNKTQQDWTRLERIQKELTELERISILVILTEGQTQTANKMK